MFFETATIGRLTARTGELDSELRRRYHESEEKADAGQYLNQLRQAFGARLWAASGIWLQRSLHRAWDRVVVTEVVKRLQDNPDPKHRLTCLEVGAGGTYSAGPNPYFGCPWLSRKLAAAFGENVDVLATDLQREPLNFFYLHTNGILFPAHLPVPRPRSVLGPVLSEVGVDGAGLKIAPVPYQEFSTLADEESMLWISKQLEQGLPANYGDLVTAPHPEGKCFLRPGLDEPVERLMFGLKVQPGVDYYRLEESFPNRQFDLVYARNLEPRSDGEVEHLVKSIERVLAPGGFICLNIDGRNRAVLRGVRRHTHLDRLSLFSDEADSLGWRSANGY
jgi:hypothetical protein